MDFPQAVHDQLDDCLRRTTILLASDLETPLLDSFGAANIPPNPYQLRFINVTISERDAQLSVLALQMENVYNATKKLDTIQTRLKENRDLVCRSLLAHQALNAPARRIPPDVWEEVFSHCLPDQPYTIPRANKCPLVLTTVCRSWRAIAMSTPRLWSSLTINLYKSHRLTYRAGTEVWLARAKSVPSALHVHNLNSTELLPVIQKWLRLFITHCNDLWWDGPSLPALFAPKTGTETETNFPIERLRLTVDTSVPSFHLSSPIKYLRTVFLESFSCSLHTLDGVKLPWDQLVELSIRFKQLDCMQFFQLLTSCSRLCTLNVSGLHASSNQVGVLRALSPGSTGHPLLLRLQIRKMHMSPDLLFNALMLPALQELDLSFIFRYRDSWPHAAFTEMVGRSQCTLKQLTVQSNKSAAEYFPEYVETMPGLVVSTS